MRRRDGYLAAGAALVGVALAELGPGWLVWLDVFILLPLWIAWVIWARRREARNHEAG